MPTVMWSRRPFRLYCLCAGMFVVGYLAGLLQGWCGAGPQKQGVTLVTPTSRSKLQLSAFLVVAIFSAPGNADRRHAIRKTWLASGSGRGVLHRFVIGGGKRVALLRKENDEHGDLLILDSVQDSFSELSRKLLEALKWMDTNADFRYLLKVDDDSFARLDALVDRLLAKQPRARLYWGFFDGRATAKKTGKWAEKEWFLCDRYLPYALGGGYVLSRDLVGIVANMGAALAHLSLYRNEDVSLGVWLAPFSVTRVHDPDFDTEYVPRGCFNSYLVTHKQTPALMRAKWDALKTHGKMCGSEYRARNSYVYDWGVLPSQCCNRSDPRVP